MFAVYVWTVERCNSSGRNRRLGFSMVQIYFHIITCSKILLPLKVFNRSELLVVNMNSSDWTVHLSLQSTVEKLNPIIIIIILFTSCLSYYCSSPSTLLNHGLQQMWTPLVSTKMENPCSGNWHSSKITMACQLSRM